MGRNGLVVTFNGFLYLSQELEVLFRKVKNDGLT